jgi:hypothetical protein
MNPAGAQQRSKGRSLREVQIPTKASPRRDLRVGLVSSAGDAGGDVPGGWDDPEPVPAGRTPAHHLLMNFVALAAGTTGTLEQAGRWGF